jgi:hypothetical protein
MQTPSFGPPERSTLCIHVGDEMMTFLVRRKFNFGPLALLLFGLLAVHCAPTFGQGKPARFWLAGRYDGNRVVVYFDAVKFKGTMSASASQIAAPVADGFFDPGELPASYIARFQNTPNAEHFAIGDRYDLLLGNGTIATIRLTTLVGCETDEEVGNDSFIGALGTIERKDSLVFAKNYYAVRRHQEPENDGAKLTPKSPAELLKFAHIGEGLVRSDVQTEIATLLNERLKMESNDAVRHEAEKAPLALDVQPFSVADGSLRYFVRAEWKSGKEKQGRPTYALAAWIAPLPTLHILAVETLSTALDRGRLPELFNVVDLGDGRTGIIVQLIGGDGRALDLLEYRDGISLLKMRALQSISFGE